MTPAGGFWLHIKGSSTPVLIDVSQSRQRPGWIVTWSLGIDLLIGMNATRLMEPWKVINSRGIGPYAVKTPLGWVVNGLMQEASCEMQGIHSCTVNHIFVADLNNLVVKQYNQDFQNRSLMEGLICQWRTSNLCISWKVQRN